MKLIRYWFEFNFADSGLHPSLLRGCGVTAYSYDDALRLLSEYVFKGNCLPPIANVIENVDVSTLDTNHILPNMGVCIWRGVWYPNITKDPIS